MRVFITGATGLIGAHTTLELLRAGHQVRLLVRNREKAERYFQSHGVIIDDYVVADMRDASAVRTGMQGCDAVVHTAAVVGVEKSQAQEIYQSNLRALCSVIDTAVEEKIKNIVYVSSVGALCNDKKLITTETVDEKATLVQSADAYRQSKADCERHVRELQKQGAPIQITYPTAVLGPDDPGMSESNNAFRIFMTQIIPLTSSGFQIVDARDIAIVHRMLLERGAPRNCEDARYIVGGYYHPWFQLAKLFEKCRGKWLLKVWLPDCLWLGIGVFLDQLKRVIPVDFPLTEEAAILVTRWVPVNSAKVERDLEFEFRSTEQTLTDTIVWLNKAGHL